MVNAVKRPLRFKTVTNNKRLDRIGLEISVKSSLNRITSTTNIRDSRDSPQIMFSNCIRGIDVSINYFISGLTRTPPEQVQLLSVSQLA